jgi:hypothetical protein
MCASTIDLSWQAGTLGVWSLAWRVTVGQHAAAAP